MIKRRDMIKEEVGINGKKRRKRGKDGRRYKKMHDGVSGINDKKRGI